MYIKTDCLTSADECLPSNVSSSLFSVLKKDSAHALSQHLPEFLAHPRAAVPQVMPLCYLADKAYQFGIGGIPAFRYPVPDPSIIGPVADP
jgi:hypothetical protein